MITVSVYSDLKPNIPAASNTLKEDRTDQASCMPSSKFTHNFTDRLEDSLRKASAINYKLKEAKSQNDTFSP